METLARINEEDGTTVVVSLHQVEYALEFCRHVVALSAGEVVYDGPASEVTAELLHQVYGSDPDADYVPGLPDVAAAQPYRVPELVATAESA
jgi:phosphonate transport system ATP-binding protein